MIRHTTPPSIRLAIENGEPLPKSVKDKLSKGIKAHKKAVADSDVLYGQLTKAASMEGGDRLSITSAKRNIVTAVKSSKEWVRVFEMYMQFETDEASNPLSEAQIIGDMNESGRALVEACDNAKVLTRLLRQHGVSVAGHALGFDQIVCEE